MFNKVYTKVVASANKIKDRYAVIGNPIHHSKSPYIHTMFATQTGQILEYGRILGDTENFAIQVQDFFNNGGKGLNVTLPFKLDAWRLADQCSDRANHAQAANTLMLMSDGKIFADNTDGLGLIRDLVHNYKIVLKERAILLLGAGGAAHGVINSIIEQEPEYVFIVNRTSSKAITLANKVIFNSKSVKKIYGGGFDAIKNNNFDIIINATSAGLTGQMPELPEKCLIKGGIVYDMLYADQSTPCMRWGLEHGANLAVDGLGMLIEQAAESFSLWRGVRPDTNIVLQALRPAAS